MEILGIAGCPYEDNEGEVLNLRVKLEDGEYVSVGEAIDIPMMDGTVLQREVKIIEPKYAGDYAAVSKKTAKRVADGEYGASDQPLLTLSGPKPYCSVVVMNVPYHEVLVEENIRAREFREELERKVCLTPFKELKLGGESIHDWVVEGYKVPTKVIAYLKTTEPYLMSPGVYEHPFKPDMRLLGPYCYTDGHYWWDRDAWKYVVNYHVKLPQKFVDYVMSGDGDDFLEAHLPWAKSWFDRIEENYGDVPHGNFLPEGAGNVGIEDF